MAVFYLFIRHLKLCIYLFRIKSVILPTCVQKDSKQSRQNEQTHSLQNDARRRNIRQKSGEVAQREEEDAGSRSCGGGGGGGGRSALILSRLPGCLFGEEEEERTQAAPRSAGMITRAPRDLTSRL